MQKFYKKESLEFIQKLANIILENYNPSIIVAVAKGGWVPSLYLSYILDVKKIASIGISYEEGDRISPVVYSVPTIIGKNSRILLVDDRLETANSISLAKDILTNNSNIIRTASMFIRKDSILIPDYYLDVIDEDISFEWFE